MYLYKKNYFNIFLNKNILKNRLLLYFHVPLLSVAAVPPSQSQSLKLNTVAYVLIAFTVLVWKSPVKVSISISANAAPWGEVIRWVSLTSQSQCRL